MTSGNAAHRDDYGSLAPGPAVDAFLETKLHRPPTRTAWVRRQRLLTRMQGVCRHPVTLLAAPVGYGKTILVSQWLEEAQPRAAWVSLDPGDNDPNRLWTHVSAALERAGSILHPRQPPNQVVDAALSPNSLLTAIVDALAAADEDVVLVLDDFHLVRDTTCHEQVQHLVQHLPPKAHLVLVTRLDPGLRLGRLRASGGLLEFRANDLAFTTPEAEDLLVEEDLTLDEEAVSLLVQHTEGWPAGLYLASLSLAARPDVAALVQSFAGRNRFIGDYLTEEVLNRHPDDVREFIITISVLDRFSAPLCDDVTHTTGSAAILQDLERTNMFLVPLDDARRWYRFHHLFAAVARAELEVTRPAQINSLHRRAAEWFRQHGNIDEAVKHSIRADDLQSAARLVQGSWLQFVDAGRIATVLGWMHAIAPPSDTDPAAAVTAAWMAALTGDEASLSQLMTTLGPFRDHGPLPDGSLSVESAMAMINGLFGYRGPVEMLRGAERAVALETNHYSPFYALAQVARGHAAFVAGDLDRAVTHLTLARHNDRAPAIIQALGLATESLVQDERGNHERSRECAESAMALLWERGLRAVPQASLAHTAVGLAQCTAGRFDDALVTLDRGLALRRETSAHGPWGVIHHLLVHARVAALAGQVDLARELLAELDSRLDRYTGGIEHMRARASSVRRLILTHGTGPAPVEVLTSREVDILRLLAGTMSLHGIAGELFLSLNTVKTHTRTVYRKLGVHTRTEAVSTGRRHGLL